MQKVLHSLSLVDHAGKGYQQVVKSTGSTLSPTSASAGSKQTSGSVPLQMNLLFFMAMVNKVMQTLLKFLPVSLRLILIIGLILCLFWSARGANFANQELLLPLCLYSGILFSNAFIDGVLNKNGWKSIGQLVLGLVPWLMLTVSTSASVCDQLPSAKSLRKQAMACGLLQDDYQTNQSYRWILDKMEQEPEVALRSGQVLLCQTIDSLAIASNSGEPTLPTRENLAGLLRCGKITMPQYAFLRELIWCSEQRMRTSSPSNTANELISSVELPVVAKLNSMTTKSPATSK